MKWITMLMVCQLARDLLPSRRSILIRRSGNSPLCHAWTSSSRSSRGNTLIVKNRPKEHWSRRHWYPRRHSHKLNLNRLYQSTSISTWSGDMAPFSEFATHVRVAKDDAPTTVESAILRSMTALGFSSPELSEDGESYIRSSNKNNKDANHPLFIVEDNTGDGDGVNAINVYGSSNARVIARQLAYHPSGEPMTPRQLLYLGCIWYLPADHYRRNKALEFQNDCADQQEPPGTGRNTKAKARRSDNRMKPSRLSLSDGPMTLRVGDYLRIHHTPRRFPMVYKVDWSIPSNSNNDNNDNDNNNDVLPAVVQQQGPGYCIIDKPPIIPVHATVDNAVENAAHQLFLALEQQQQNATAFDRDQNNNDRNSNATKAHNLQHHHNQTEEPPYLAAVQRIDVNTSGLLVLATSPEFAAYFSQLLRRKTAAIHDHGNNSNEKNNSNNSNSKRKINGGSSDTTPTSNMNATSASPPTIEKGYKCLVCIQPDEGSGESVLQAWQRLSNLQRPKSKSPSIDTEPGSGLNTNANSDTNTNTNNTMIIRHYLKASDRAPKLFVDRIPNDDDDGDDDSKWYECLMEITDVGEPVPLYATTDDDEAEIETPTLANRLWPNANAGVGEPGNSKSHNRMPPTAKAVVEVHVSLITGRTHQIRGQLSKLGFPIVGDEQYGGAVPMSTSMSLQESSEVARANIDASHSEEPQLLALQCCHIGFRDAEYEEVWNKKKRRYLLRGRPSKSQRWVRATLERTWWTPFLEEHTSAGNQFSDIDIEEADDDIAVVIEPAQDSETTADIDSSTDDIIRSDMLPPSVQLSPGRNKYVVAKLRDPSTEKLRWFVQSAPLPYHAEVAFELVEWIHAVPGYEHTRVEVTGGGRIDYSPSSSTARVYGFSYRYGKGDHARVANLIEASAMGTDLTVTHDLSDNLY